MIKDKKRFIFGLDNRTTSEIEILGIFPRHGIDFCVALDKYA